ncbi:hypothetical protein [Dyella psychrodurans]|uniref:Uncharacterized protein n=1 Tax=Dyella psychrodurans TaxID=1927960 RepID=A0A370XCG4_9GAMM|nr:hypothetical protein [Dyella psychrodurans]RDS86123.1 hypothetical protein DWU99_02310 [Dyella psychrodurans]
MLCADDVGRVLRAVREASVRVSDAQPALSGALDACVLMLLDAASEDGVALDVSVFGFAEFGVVDD